jgi:hypothetical protein
MGVLDQIKSMRQEGMDDTVIIDRLKDQKIPPASITDAFNQIKIKEAVSAGEDYTLPVPSPIQKRKMPQEQFYTPRTKEIEPSAEDPGNFQIDDSGMQQQDYYNPEDNSQNQGYPNPPVQGGNSQQEYYPQYNYDEYSPQQAAGYGADTDSIIEIAEQVFSEKTKELQKQIEMMSEFATLAENKIENNTERIKRMEKMIDNLQIKILEKVGSYGENLNSVKKEMSMMQESFSKVLPELAEAKHKTHSEHKTEHKK